MTWAPLPAIENPSTLQQQVSGFWEWVSEHRVTDSGEVVSTTTRGRSVLVYTPSGHVGVHFQPEGWGAIPAQDQAERAVSGGYTSYMGVVTVFPKLELVNHWLLAALSPQQEGDSFRRLARVTGSILMLRFFPRIENGREVRNVVTLRRLSGEEEMR
jgi:hypothetical protein